MPGIGISIVLIAVGAILDFAVSVQNSHGINLNTIGVILMIVGGVGLLISLVMYGSDSWGPRRHSTMIDDGQGNIVRREDVSR
jgi:hypothetical protein